MQTVSFSPFLSISFRRGLVSTLPLLCLSCHCCPPCCHPCKFWHVVLSPIQFHSLLSSFPLLFIPFSPPPPSFHLFFSPFSLISLSSCLEIEVHRTLTQTSLSLSLSPSSSSFSSSLPPIPHFPLHSVLPLLFLSLSPITLPRDACARLIVSSYLPHKVLIFSPSLSCARARQLPPRHRNPCDVAPKHTEAEDTRHLRRPPPPLCGLVIPDVITVLQQDLGKYRGHGSTACGTFFGGAAAEPVCHARHTDCMFARQHHWRPSWANPMLPCTRNIPPPRTQADRRRHLGPRPWRSTPSSALLALSLSTLSFPLSAPSTAGTAEQATHLRL